MSAARAVIRGRTRASCCVGRVSASRTAALRGATSWCSMAHGGFGAMTPADRFRRSPSSTSAGISTCRTRIPGARSRTSPCCCTIGSTQHSLCRKQPRPLTGCPQQRSRDAVPGQLPGAGLVGDWRPIHPHQPVPESGPRHRSPGGQVVPVRHGTSGSTRGCVRWGNQALD